MLAMALRQPDGSFLGEVPIAPPAGLLAALAARSGAGRVLVGFDHPIGLPAAYAEPAGLRPFPNWLAEMEDGSWDRLRTPAASPDEIDRDRPFYPLRPSGASRAALATGHRVAGYGDLLRRCDRGTSGRPPACCMLWTLGPKQCGRAALAGWHEILRPALRGDAAPALWPFDGALADLLARGGSVVAETYPAEFYAELGPRRRFSKRRQADRQALGDGLCAAAGRAGLQPGTELAAAIAHGFGPGPRGENAFDATVGLIGMLLTLRGLRPADPPPDLAIRRHEGWMLGLDAATLRG
jgi:hypothetical protein